ncbi:erythromycin esterase family protein [Nannocystis punicea]|uniref:Erythromycin esterase family protein n=1 Tax=Nannocystis punicea TaxID=2995304 RepID=A0ABY7GSX9_9BACT|nr:erythromycin esterase family protein [Nannocystis poenicansa]WAS90034.1 erythromycin esterase family protein [Nannocystis poenicansa]
MARFSPRMRIAAVVAALGLTAGCAPWRADARAWASAQPTITRELEALARPLAGLDADVPSAAPVWAMVRDARVIGVGEGTHGTREFRRLLHGLVVHAAHEQQPVVLAVELPFNLVLALDAWAGHGWFPDPEIRERDLSDPRLLGTHWLGAVQECRELFTWIRDFNREVPPERQIRIFGVDVCMSLHCGAEIVDYLRDVDPDIEPRARDLVVPLRGFDLERTRSPALAARAREDLAELRTMLVERRARIVERQGSDTYELVQRLVWLAERRVDIALVGGDNPVSHEREQAMAETVAWIRDRLGDHGRVLLHAHNGHVGRSRPRMPNGRLSHSPQMGEHLAARLGSDYAVVYSTFDAGEFLAFHTLGWVGAEKFKTRALRAFSVRSAPRGTLEATLRAPTAYALDVGEATAGAGPLADYLRAEHWSRTFTYAWRPSFAVFPVGWTGVVPVADFDVLVYVPRAAATHP